MKRLLLFHFLVLSSLITYAQDNPDSAKVIKQKMLENELYNQKYIYKYNSKIINDSKIIFEGEVIEATNNGEYVFESILIKSVFKGNSAWNGKTVEIVYPTPGNHSFGFSVSAAKGVFFCNTNNLSKNPKRFKTDIDVSISLTGFVGIQEATEGVSGLYKLGFDTLEAFYQYLGTHPNVKLDNSVYLKKTPAASRVKSKISYKEWLEHWEKKARDEKKKNTSASRINSTQAVSTISYSFSTPTITSSNGKQYFEVDIKASVDNSSTYFANALFRIQYDPAIFGANIEGSGKLTVTKGTKFNTPTYIVPEPVI